MESLITPKSFYALGRSKVKTFHSPTFQIPTKSLTKFDLLMFFLKAHTFWLTMVVFLTCAGKQP